MHGLTNLKIYGTPCFVHVMLSFHVLQQEIKSNFFVSVY